MFPVEYLAQILQGFNWAAVVDYINKPFYVLFWIFFINGGFIFFTLILLWCVYKIYIDTITGVFITKIKRVSLSISIPKNSTQTPRGIEALFTQLLSTHANVNYEEKYFKGKIESDPISFEIVSVDGYIQFIIYCAASARDVIESSIFSQYPDAEIMEVPDYAQNFPDKFPSEEWDMWGTELDLKPKDYYPIKTYTDFIDEDAEEDRFKDPLAAILEIMSKLRKGENLCIQLLVRPKNPKNEDWQKEVRKEINTIIGVKEPVAAAKQDPFLAVFSPFIMIFKDIISQILTTELSKDAEVKKEEKPDLLNWATKLKPDQKIAIEMMEKKFSKKVLQSKIRVMYIGKKEVFSKARGVTGIMGTFSQFNNVYGASFVPQGDVTTAVKYFSVAKRTAKKQSFLIKAYKARSMWRGKAMYHLNTEELASIFHFPNITVKAPMITKVESKKVEPPMDLPTLD